MNNQQASVISQGYGERKIEHYRVEGVSAPSMDDAWFGTYLFSPFTATYSRWLGRRE